VGTSVSGCGVVSQRCACGTNPCMTQGGQPPPTLHVNTGTTNSRTKWNRRKSPWKDRWKDRWKDPRKDRRKDRRCRRYCLE
jgi:hypothetical protein